MFVIVYLGVFANAKYLIALHLSATFHRQQRGAAKWSPDAEFMQQFNAPVMYPDEVSSLWKMPPYNSE